MTRQLDQRVGPLVAGKTITAGGAVLARLKAVGVDYTFANSGTDFPPIIEGLAEASAKDIALPKALVTPHENAAMGMAHGYFFRYRQFSAHFDKRCPRSLGIESRNSGDRPAGGYLC
jgi:hypothetical protein